MTTIKIYLRNKVSAKGLFPIVLRVTKNRKSKLINLGLNCKKEHWKDGGFTRACPNSSTKNRVVLKLKERALAIIDGYQLDEIDFTLSQFVDKFRNNNKSITVSEFWLEKMVEWNNAGRVGYARSQKDTYKSFFKFIGNHALLFKDLTPEVLNKYENHQRANGCIDGGIAFKMRELRVIFNAAITVGVVDEKYYPFKLYKVSKLKGKRLRKALTREEVRLIENLDLNDYPHLVDSRNYMVFSYYTGGMNFVDMLKLRWENIQGERIQYSRTKTDGRFSVKILEPVARILAKYKAQQKETGYVFPLLLNQGLTPLQIEYRRQKTLKKFNKQLKEMASLVGLECNVSSYTFRHSYATNLKHAGISTDIIGESMGHHDVGVTKAYLKEFEDDVIDNAMDKLLEEPAIIYMEVA